MSIKVIEKATVNRICSGQVIVDLATSVKELVENALDAHATSITVTLKEMGVERIEVADNGRGIHSDDYESVALKHFTSKLDNFSDLDSVASFGFRGEALNSICELSEALTVSTKQSSEAVGTVLSFQRDGRLHERKLVARGTGTTVCIDKLFESLPVRRGEFVRNIKKQYQRLLKVLQSYAIIAVGVKIAVYNLTKAGKHLVLGSEGGKSLEENISSVFGSAFLSSLMPLHLVASLGDDSVEDAATVTGFVSKVGEGVGRSDNDRQFVFCNGRPVDMPKISKLFSESWRRFEMKHKPAYVVSILVPAGYVDVNLAPDKREVVLRQEAQLLETLKLSVEELYAPSRYTFRVAEGTLRGYVRDVAESQQSSSSSERALSGEEVGPVADEGLCEEIKEAESVFSDETPSDPQVSRVVAVAETLVEEIVPLPAPPAPVMSAPASSARGDSRAPLCQRVNVSVDLAKFKAIYGKQNASKRPLDSLFESPSKLRSKADVTLPSIADSPSKVLSRVLSKADFLDMRILGQFNLGFIIAELRGDLYLLDQHASDEKYNFEKLQESTVIHKQQLLSPLILEVSGADEAVIESNLDVFAANGFRIEVDTEAELGQRLKLHTLPYSKATTFDQTDVLELASLLHNSSDESVTTLVLKNDSAHSTLKCPKLVSMFASRACRKSVMIGTALKVSEMKRIVSNLATIEQPWNCPHGRPTMRHLENMDNLRRRKIMNACALISVS